MTFPFRSLGDFPRQLQAHIRLTHGLLDSDLGLGNEETDQIEDSVPLLLNRDKASNDRTDLDLTAQTGTCS